MKKIKELLWIYIIQVMETAIMIYAIDKIFASMGNGTYVGINPVTLGFTGVAGIPGVIVLFSLAFVLKRA